MMHNARQEIVEKIVEKEVIKEVRVGISEVRTLLLCVVSKLLLLRGASKP
jgi:hypothetical protein